MSVNPTRVELAWAITLKEAAQQVDSRVDASLISDWEYLQSAIVVKGDTAKALQRLRHLQAFKRQYGIIRDGSVEEAARDLRTFLQTHPGLYLSLADAVEEAANEETNVGNCSSPATKLVGTQVFCSEYQYFQVGRMTSEEAYSIYMRAAFYTLQASQYNLPSLRAGLLLLMDVHGALKYRSFKTEARARELYGKAYPIRIQGVVLLRSGRMLRIAYKWLIRPLLSRKVKDTLTMPMDPKDEQDFLASCGVPKSTLPTSWGGDMPVDGFHEIILGRLRKRYHMEETFRL